MVAGLYRCRAEAVVPARDPEEAAYSFAEWLRSTGILEAMVVCEEYEG